MERVDAESSSFFGSSRVSSIERCAVGGFRYVIAESELGGKRRHRRMIADEPEQPLLNGKPLFYLDTYQGTGAERTYVYARHLVDPSGFFATLNLLVEAEQLREYRAKAYRGVFNLAGEFLERQVALSDLGNSLAAKDLRFCRLFFPFGDVAVEFGPPFSSGEDELENARHYRRLTKRLESPLLGCDLSRTLAMGTLIVDTHWSSRQIPASILQAMLEEVARAPVTA